MTTKIVLERDFYSHFSDYLKENPSWENMIESSDISVMELSGRIHGLNDLKSFIKEISEINGKLFSESKTLSEYNLYLFQYVNLENPKSKVAQYRKIWLKLKEEGWDLTKFIIGDEALVKLDNNSAYYTALAQFELHDLDYVIGLVNTRPRSSMILASRKGELLDSDFNIRLFNIVFEDGKKDSKHNIDVLRLAMILCNEDVVVFRWGHYANDETALQIIFPGFLFDDFQYSGPKKSDTGLEA